MRKIAFLAAVAATLCTVACNKNIEAPTAQVLPGQEAELGQLTISIVGNNAATKALSAADETNYSKVKDLQIFVFDGETLDVYAIVSNTTSATVTCRQGTKTVYAVVNAPAITNVKTVDQLKSIGSQLSDNDEAFVMVGSKTGVSVPSGEPIEIEVKRIVARVALKKITLAFTNSAYPGMGAKQQKVYLVNVPTDTNLGLTLAPTNWINKMAYSSTDEPRSFVSDVNSYDLMTTDYNEYLYSYPNPTVSDANGGSWSARHTRLVVETLIDGNTYYYPITLPALEAGKSYEIENLTLTRLGSTNPDQPVQLSDATFEISVKDWTVVPITEGITI